jgi:hypothetical protein
MNGLQYRIVYIQGVRKETLDTIYTDYRMALDEMQQIAKEAFAEQRELEGRFTLEVLNIPEIWR